MDKTLENIELAKRRRDDVRGKEKLISKLELELAEILREVLNQVPLNQFNAIYDLEGLVGTYETSPVQTSDFMTPDHQPQASVLKFVATLPAFSGRVIQAVAGDKMAKGGATINIQDKRHKAGRTHGAKGTGTAAIARSRILSAIAPFPGNEGRQREEVITILKHELDDDVDAMKVVANKPNTDPVWNDINSQPLPSQQQKDELIVKIRRQIIAGEDRIRGQRLGRYKEER
jgi:hypothetical protein